MRDGEALRLRSEGLSWRKIEDEIVVLDQKHSLYFAVNGTGADLWELLHAGTDRGALIAALVTGHTVDHHVAAADVDAFLGNLRDEGLLDAGS